MYKQKILNLLRSTKTDFRSGEDLARKCGISRTMVWKHIKALEREGFSIEAVPSQGYRIVGVPDILRLDDIKKGLRSRIMGKGLHLLPRTDSTNSVAMQMAAQGEPEGSVVIAETQSGGRGRLGRTWISPPGNLYLSVILRPDIPLHKAPCITLMGAVAAAAAIRKTCQVEAGIKWPNDILISGKKVCGLLTEMSAEQDRIRHIVLGIGMDVNMRLTDLPPGVREFSTTLAAETGSLRDRTALLQQLLSDLEHWYRIFLHNDRDVLDAWTGMNVTTGNRIAVSNAGAVFEGTAQRIDRDGRLLILRDNGMVQTVSAGDVTIVKNRGQGHDTCSK